MRGRHDAHWLWDAGPILLIILALLGGGLLAVTDVGAATNHTTTTNNSSINQTAPIYPNSSGNVSFLGWVPDGNVSLDSLGNLLTRVAPAVIGTGGMDPSGTGFTGTLLTGLLIIGSAGFAVIGTGVGPVGGTVLGLVVGFGVVGLGVWPVWFRPLLLFAVGMVVAVAFLTVYRS